MFSYLDFIKGFTNDNENVKKIDQKKKKNRNYIQESATVPDLIGIAKRIFIKNKETNLEDSSTYLYTIPLVFNMLNNAGNMLLECSR